MIVLTLVVRDEEDVVGWNLDYHLSRGVDFCVATLHRSRDGTRALLAGHERRGRAYVFEEEGEAFEQGPWVTRMARFAHDKLAADWVLHGDADEFWWPHEGDLPEALARLPADAGGALVRRRNARPVRGDGPFFERMIVWERRSRNGLGEPLQPKVCHRGAPDVVVAYGNHSVSSPSLGPIVPFDGIEILHFPMRSYAQFAAKIEHGSRALASNAALGPRIGNVWRTLEGLRRHGELAGYFERYRVDVDAVREGRAGDGVEIDERLREYMEELSARGTRAAASREWPPAPRGDPRCGS